MRFKLSWHFMLATLGTITLLLAVGGFFLLSTYCPTNLSHLPKPRRAPTSLTLENELVKSLPCVLLYRCDGKTESKSLIVEPKDLLIYEALATTISSELLGGPAGNRLYLCIQGYSPCDELLRRINKHSLHIWCAFGHETKLDPTESPFQFDAVQWLTKNEATVASRQGLFLIKYSVTINDSKYLIKVLKVIEKDA